MSHFYFNLFRNPLLLLYCRPIDMKTYLQRHAALILSNAKIQKTKCFILLIAFEFVVDEKLYIEALDRFVCFSQTVQLPLLSKFSKTETTFRFKRKQPKALIFH